MANRLAHETSPYLQQHADNPVDWHPWGEEALRFAREQNKPILLSVGYSACHWCHVMAHESFEDPGVAEVMNRLFVNIKVDREERPDIDQIYQTAHQMLTRRTGGWPLTMFLTPDQAILRRNLPKTARYNCRDSANSWSVATAIASRARRLPPRTEPDRGAGATLPAAAPPSRASTWRRRSRALEQLKEIFDPRTAGWVAPRSFRYPAGSSCACAKGRCGPTLRRAGALFTLEHGG